MTTNRYAFVNFTGKPYIHYHGISYNKPANNQVINNQMINLNEPERTIIRTNNVPVNGVNDINNFQNNPSTWSNFDKNDNMLHAVNQNFKY